MVEQRGVYVYVYLDPRKPGVYLYDEYEFDYEPLYVGKGRRHRMRDHICYVKQNKPRTRNRLKFNKIRKILDLGLEPYMEVVLRDATDEMALALEERLILLIGRIDLETGPLTNLTGGGEGAGGYRFSQEQRDSLSRAHAGKVLSEEHKKHIGEASRRRWADPEYKEMVSQKHRGKRMSLEAIQKRIETFKRRGHGRWMRGRTLSVSTRKKIGLSKATLTVGQVLEMRKLFDSGECTQSELSRMFGTSTTNVHSIVHRKTWRYVDESDL